VGFYSVVCLVVHGAHFKRHGLHISECALDIAQGLVAIDDFLCDHCFWRNIGSNNIAVTFHALTVVSYGYWVELIECRVRLEFGNTGFGALARSAV
jgi:hypothetical protein